MKNILKFVFIASMFLFVSGYSFIANAVVDNNINSPILSSVGIHNIKVLSQDGNNVNLSFEISNKEKIQTGVKYSVKLVKESEKGQFVVDEKVYDESLTLSENSFIQKEITYNAPSGLDGEYSLLIVSRSESGYVFSVSYGGKIELKRTKEGVYIMNETCNITVNSDKFKRSYSLTDGVDINQEENLVLNCKVINTLATEASLTPKFETHFRTIYGEKVPHIDVTNEKITLSPKEEKSVSITLPKAKSPQAYDVKTSLSYNGGESNSVVAHYVIQGVSATIQNASLDKDFYMKGETANILFSWFPSADNFPNSRLGKATEVAEIFVKGRITNNTGLKCVDDIYEPLSQDHNTMKNNISLPVKRDCVNPNLSFSLLDKDGNVLDERTFSVETASKEAPQNTNTKMIIIIIAILVVIVLLVIFFIKNKKSDTGINNNTIASIAILAIFLFGLAFSTIKTNANQLVINGGETGGSGVYQYTASTGVTPPGLSATIGLDQLVYDANFPVGVTASLYYVACTNATRNIIATGYITNENRSYTGPTKTLFNSTISGTESQIYNTAIFTAPSAPGNYVLNVKVEGYVPQHYYMTDDYDNVDSIDFPTFIQNLKYYINTYHSANPNLSTIYTILNSAKKISDLNAITTYIGTMTFFEETSSLVFTREYKLPVKVVGVTSYINQKRPTDNVDYDGSASIEWTAVNPVYGCRCSFTPESGSPATTYCGESNPNVEDFGPYTVNNLKINTEFSVECPTYNKPYFES